MENAANVHLESPNLEFLEVKIKISESYLMLLKILPMYKLQVGCLCSLMPGFFTAT